jgi:hypothetical protein
MIVKGIHRWQLERVTDDLGFALIDLHPERPGDWNGQSWRFRVRAATPGALFTVLPEGRRKKPIHAICVHGYKTLIARLAAISPGCRLITVWGTFKDPREIGRRYGRSCVCEATGIPAA